MNDGVYCRTTYYGNSVGCGVSNFVGSCPRGGIDKECRRNLNLTCDCDLTVILHVSDFHSAYPTSSDPAPRIPADSRGRTKKGIPGPRVGMGAIP